MQNEITSTTPKQPIKVAALKKTFRLFRYVKPYWPEFALGLLFLLISSLAGLAFGIGSCVRLTAAGNYE
jgi:hypothetical protein